MATWKKIVVSGSAISQLANDANLIYSNSADVSLTGSFSGSFVGDGSGLTGVVASGTISSSAQIAADISGSFTSVSASIATDIANLDNDYATDAELNAATQSLSASLAADIATEANNVDSLQSFSSSLSSTVITYTGSFSGDGSSLTNITVDQNSTVTASFSSASLVTNSLTSSITHNFNSDNIIVTVYDDSGYQFLPSAVFLKNEDEVEIHFAAAEGGKVIVARGGHIVSGSIPYDNILNKPALISGSAQIATDISGSSTALSSSIASRVTTEEGNVDLLQAHQANLLAFTGSAARRTAISGAFTATSASIATDIANISTSFTLSADSGADDTFNSGDTLTIAGTSNEIETTVSDNQIQIGLPDNVTIGNNLTVSGNFTVSGTQTIVDSNTLDIGDNIIALNGTGATKGGLAVNDADGPSSGSLLWDGANNYWIAGATGSEVKILLASGDDVVSGSAQLAADISGSSNALSSSIASRVTAQEVFSSSLDDTFTTAAELNAATSSLSSSLAADIATNVSNHTALDGEVTALMAATGSQYDHISNLNAFTGSASRRTAISGAFTPTSESLASRVTDQENFSASLDATFATEAELNTATSSLSSSLATDIATNLASITTLEGKTLVSESAQVVTLLDGQNVTLGTVTAEEIVTNVISQSITLATGSNIFGDSLSDTHQFTGSIAVTGSVTATSFVGDGSGLTGVTTDISDLNSHTASVNTFTGSIDGEVTNLMAATGSQYAHIANLNTFTGSAERRSAISGSITSFSSSIAGRVSTEESNVDLLQAHQTNLLASTGSRYSHIEGLLTFTGSADRRSAISGAFTPTSESLASRVTAQEVFSSSLDDTFATTAELHTATSSLSASLAADIATEANNVDALQVFSQSFDTAFNLDGANVTVAGNFTVAGTQTIVDSNTVDIGDNIIALNGTGATKGGLAVNDGPASGSLLWDGTNDYWIAGPSGSEVKILLASGDDVISGSAQIASEISGSFTALSSSIASRVTTEENNVDVAQSHIGNIHAFTASADGEITSLMSFTGSFSSSVASEIKSLQDFSSSLDDSFVTEGELNTATSSLSSSLAADIATNLSSISTLEGKTLVSGSSQIGTDISGSFTATSASIAEDIAGITTSFTLAADSGADDTFESGQTLTIAGAGPITTTVSDNQISIDVTDAIISGSSTALSSSIAARVTANEVFSSSLDATFASEADLNTATSSLSSSLATDIATNLSKVTTLENKALVSSSILASPAQGEVRLNTNGVDASAVDLGLQTTDSPTFAGLTVTGDLVVTGDTIESQVTNLNVEDKYILINSGSTSGDSGIIFGGADGVANQGVGLFWDNGYNSNDGRLGIVNSIAAGATGDQTPSYHIAGVFEGTEANAATAQADHVGNIRVEGEEIYIYV